MCIKYTLGCFAKVSAKKIIIFNHLIRLGPIHMHRYLFVICITCFTFLFSCRPKKETKTYTIAFSQCIGNDAWRETMLKEMKRELSFHPEINFLYADAGGDNNKQIAQVKTLLKEHIDLLIISPNEAEPLTPVVDEVFQKGIPVIVTDRKTSSGLYNAYVGSDNYDIGYLAGKYISQQLNKRGNIAIITGLPGSSASIEREKGFKTALKDFPAVQLKEELNGQWLINVAFTTVLNHIETLRNTDAIFAFNDQMAIGARKALLKIHPNNNIKIIGVDALPGKGNGLEQIAKGNIDASMLYPTGGVEAIRTATAILNKQAYKRENILSTLVIDSSSVQLMKMQADKIDSQQQDIDKQQGLLAEQKNIYQDQQSILNILIVSLVLAIVFAGIAIYTLKSNWEKNKHLEMQNVEILKQQQQLIEMSDKVKEASDAKTNFFTNISHEFKTPLTLILAPVEDLLKDASLSGSLKDQLLRIKRNGLRLINLVSELIDIQRLGQEKIKLRASSNNLIKFLNQIIASFKPLSVQKSIPLTLENKTTIANLWFDADLMEKAMYNLLSNAFKFTQKNGRIQIKVEQNTFGDYIIIRVIDNGRGINKADIDHIFDPFYQGTYSAIGSGLGLALVKNVIELHHGQITVSSKENEGTSFTLRLPVGDAHLSDIERVDPSEQLNNRSEVNPTFTLPDMDEQPDSREALKPYHRQEHTLLIIDDNEEIVRFLRDKFSDSYHIYSALTAEDGIKLAYSKVPDLILSDVVMPGKSGLELVGTLKNDHRTSSIPIILLTALDSEEQKTLGLQAMADAYITKPFSTAQLEAIIKNLITTRKELKERFTSEINPSNDHLSSTLSEIDRRFLNNLSAVVETHLGDSQFSIDHICKEIGMSRVQLYRKVKALLSCSVNDYIMIRRLKKSKYLLQQDITINEVAYQTGFSSPTYFATLFKTKFGISPSAFKKQTNKG
jgi:signal transduction histidine kinase/DNA-binding response OmpR family regulator